jgi:hypothetical protein
MTHRGRRGLHFFVALLALPALHAGRGPMLWDFSTLPATLEPDFT